MANIPRLLYRIHHHQQKAAIRRPSEKLAASLHNYRRSFPLAAVPFLPQKSDLDGEGHETNTRRPPKSLHANRKSIDVLHAVHDSNILCRLLGRYQLWSHRGFLVENDRCSVHQVCVLTARNVVWSKCFG